MPQLAAVKATNASFSPAYTPVAVFVGGTYGIGQHMIEALARHLGGNLHVVLVARNRAAAEKILSSLPIPSDADREVKPMREFIEADITLMKNVKTLCNDLLSRLPKINYLVLSAGFLRLGGGRDETEEGLDKLMSIRYYSRWKLIQELLPLLNKAKDLGEDATVLSILGTGNTIPVDLDDLGLEKKYTPIQAAKVTIPYTDYMMEEFAIRYPGIGFKHIHPGAVNTPTVYSLHSTHWLLKYFSPLLNALINLITTPPADCAEYMLYALLDGQKGFARYNRYGDNIGLKNHPGEEKVRRLIWEHSAEATKTLTGE